MDYEKEIYGRIPQGHNCVRCRYLVRSTPGAFIYRHVRRVAIFIGHIIGETHLTKRKISLYRKYESRIYKKIFFQL